MLILLVNLPLCQFLLSKFWHFSRTQCTWCKNENISLDVGKTFILDLKNMNKKMKTSVKKGHLAHFSNFLRKRKMVKNRQTNVFTLCILTFSHQWLAWIFHNVCDAVKGCHSCRRAWGLLCFASDILSVLTTFESCTAFMTAVRNVSSKYWEQILAYLRNFLWEG